MKTTIMKKALLSGIVVSTALLPAASASAMAGGTNISSSQSQGSSVNANKSNSNSSSQEAYVNKSVSYEALYYVKYDASVTEYVKNMQNAQNQASLAAQYYNNANSQFSMPSYISSYYN